MSVSAMKKMIDPYIGSLKTLPHDVVVKAIASAKDGGVVSSGESAKLFDALQFKPADKFEVAADRQAIRTARIVGRPRVADVVAARAAAARDPRAVEDHERAALPHGSKRSVLR